VDYKIKNVKEKSIILRFFDAVLCLRHLIIFII